jgi:hypothetical protein
MRSRYGRTKPFARSSVAEHDVALVLAGVVRLAGADLIDGLAVSGAEDTSRPRPSSWSARGAAAFVAAISRCVLASVSDGVSTRGPRRGSRQPSRAVRSETTFSLKLHPSVVSLRPVARAPGRVCCKSMVSSPSSDLSVRSPRRALSAQPGIVAGFVLTPASSKMRISASLSAAYRMITFCTRPSGRSAVRTCQRLAVRRCPSARSVDARRRPQVIASTSVPLIAHPDDHWFSKPMRGILAHAQVFRPLGHVAALPIE